MNKKLSKSVVPQPSDGRETTASDVLEASEIIRATLTMLRVSSGVTFFAGQYTGLERYNESLMKDIASEFDSLSRTLQQLYSELISNYKTLEHAGAGCTHS